MLHLGLCIRRVASLASLGSRSSSFPGSALTAEAAVDRAHNVSEVIHLFGGIEPSSQSIQEVS